MPRRIDKQQKQEQILQAALSVFAQKGFSATRMNDIARKAGIGKGTLYEYFSSKEDIFFKTFFYLFEQYDKTFQERLELISDPVEKIRLIVQTYFVEFSQHNFDFMQIMMDYWMASARNNQTHNFSLLALYRNYRHQIGAILQEGIDKQIFRAHNTEHYAAMLLALLDGLFLQLFLDNQVFDLQAMAASIEEMFLTSLKLNSKE